MGGEDANRARGRGLGTLGTLGRGGGRGSRPPERILTCSHEVPLYAVRDGEAFAVATLEPGPEIQLFDTSDLADGLQPVVIPDVPLSLRRGVGLGTKPTALEDCKPPRDGGGTGHDSGS